MVAAPMVSVIGDLGAGPDFLGSRSLVAVLVYVLLIAPVCLFYSIFDAYHTAQVANRTPKVSPPRTTPAPSAPVESGPAAAGSTESGYAANNQHALTWGVILTGGGLVTLIWSVGGYRMNYVLRLWPLILVALGVLVLAGNLRRAKAPGQ